MRISKRVAALSFISLVLLVFSSRHDEGSEVHYTQTSSPAAVRGTESVLGSHPGDKEPGHRAMHQPSDPSNRTLNFPNFDASIDGEGVLSLKSRGPDPQVLELRTSKIERGKRELPGNASDVYGSQNSFVVDRRVAHEEFVKRPGGLEQRWLFAEAPSEEGDLVIEVEFSGLQLQRLTETDNYFLVDDSGTSVFRYGPAIWVDSAGKRVEIAQYQAGNSLRMTVPSQVVDKSVYPAVLDPVIHLAFETDPPLIMNHLDDRATNVGVAATEERILAAWTDSQRVYASFLRNDGVVTTTRPLTISSLNLGDMPVAVGSDGEDFIVVWIDYISPDYRLLAKRVSSAGHLIDLNPLDLTAAGGYMIPDLPPSITYADGTFVLASLLRGMRPHGAFAEFVVFEYLDSNTLQRRGGFTLTDGYNVPGAIFGFDIDCQGTECYGMWTEHDGVKGRRFRPTDMALSPITTVQSWSPLGSTWVTGTVSVSVGGGVAHAAWPVQAVSAAGWLHEMKGARVQPGGTGPQGLVFGTIDLLDLGPGAPGANPSITRIDDGFVLSFVGQRGQEHPLVSRSVRWLEGSMQVSDVSDEAPIGFVGRRPDSVTNESVALVVTPEYDNGQVSRVVGKRFRRATGELFDYPLRAIPISKPRNSQVSPSVAFNVTDGTSMVAWLDNRPLAGSHVLDGVSRNYYPYVGIYISSGQGLLSPRRLNAPHQATMIDVSSNAWSDQNDSPRYLVVWDRFEPGGLCPHRVVARRFDSQGSQVGSELTIACPYQGATGVLIRDIAVGSAPDPSLNPLEPGGWLVSWVESSGSQVKLKTRTVSADGVLGTVRDVTFAQNSISDVSVTRVGASYLLVWQETSGNLKSLALKAVDFDGSFLPTEWRRHYATNPSATYVENEGAYVAWFDEYSGRVYGTFLRPGSQHPGFPWVIREFHSDSLPGEENYPVYNPVIGSDGHRLHLIVRSWEFPYYEDSYGNLDLWISSFVKKNNSDELLNVGTSPLDDTPDFHPRMTFAHSGVDDGIPVVSGADGHMVVAYSAPVVDLGTERLTVRYVGSRLNGEECQDSSDCVSGICSDGSCCDSPICNPTFCSCDTGHCVPHESSFEGYGHALSCTWEMVLDGTCLDRSCYDHMDNDCDGLRDPEDPSCNYYSCAPFGWYWLDGVCVCPGGGQELCSDGLDNDCDGLVDCDDPDCTTGPEYGNCADGIDNDCDGYVDCEDEDCKDMECGEQHVCRAELCCMVEEAGPEACSDDLDNDCDGAVDCEDLSCEGSLCVPFCSNPKDCPERGRCRDKKCKPCELKEELSCDDGLDEDCDGKVDCEDEDCDGRKCRDGAICKAGACVKSR